MNGNYIEIVGLNYKKIIENINIAFEKNKIITVSGPNNCGKTTLIRILSKQLECQNAIIINNKKLEDYSIIELNSILKTVIPMEIDFKKDKLKDELLYAVDKNLLNELLQKFDLNKKINNKISNMSNKDIIIIQIIKSLLSKNSIILIDDLSEYLNHKEIEKIFENIRYFSNKNKNTIIYFTTDLYTSIYTDYIYVINNKEIVIEGLPLDVLKNDNVINKNGLDIPFMVDLSVKLKDYDLVSDVILNMEDMVNTLWK